MINIPMLVLLYLYNGEIVFNITSYALQMHACKASHINTWIELIVINE